jgi:hypothetical protein
MTAITVNGSLCSAATSAGYVNKPCVSVTICAPGSTTNCQTINDILLDTGDYGLRIFKQALSVPLTPVASGSGTLGECVTYAAGSVWGSVQMASVVLGGEPAVQVPILVADSTFANGQAVCTGIYTSPSDAGFNGTLGLGPFPQDCGEECASSPAGPYYSCTGSTCTVVAVPLQDQVQNPVSLLPADNNGVVVELPPVPQNGAASVNGTLVFGIGTQSNNTPSPGVAAYGANQAVFTTAFEGTTYTDESFVDSGSNALFFPTPSSLTVCSSSSAGSGWLCASPSPQDFSATTTGASGSPTGTVPFQIVDATTLFQTTNNVFSTLGGPWTSTPLNFDWGLPFFFGRNVYIGIDGTRSSLGTGPYWGY